MNALAFQIRLLQPVLAGQPNSGEANSNVSYPFIPGSMLRGALAACYSGGKLVDLSKDSQFGDLFLNGQVRFLNAYPIYPDGNIRMLPRPLSWFVKKADVQNQNAQVCDFALGDANPGETYKPPAGDFFCFLGSSVKLMTPEMNGIVHNASTDRNRKKEGSSQVYRYDTLSAGQVFGAAVLSESLEMLKQIKKLLETHDLVLGGSINGGYGRAEVLKPLYVDPDWSEDKGYPHTVSQINDVVYLTCLSDVIYRDQDGAVDFDLKTLAGQPPLKVYRRERMVGGYSRKWGLPAIQEWTVGAGSVFVFPAGCRAALEAKVESGVGERLAEGFGRIALDLQIAPIFNRSGMAVRKMVVHPLVNTLSPVSQNFAQTISNRRLQNELDHLLVQRVHQIAGSKTAFRQLPKPAQLARARQAARSAWQSGNLQLIKNHFKGLSELSLRTWKNATLGGEPLKEWILQRVDDPNIESFHVGAIAFAGVKADFTSKLRAQLIAQLIDGVLKQAVEYAKQEGGNA